MGGTYVKVVYGSGSLRKPSLTKYSKKANAESFISVCEKWGIDIESVGIVSEEEASKLIGSDKVEYDEE